jgi:DNA-binding GntR family transcriptional regulator
VPLVQDEIERMIAAGEVQGGDRINESALAVRLAVSRGPIREACRMLERIGLLRSELNRGFFVREVSLKEALDLYDVRASLFGLAGRLLATSISAVQLFELDDLVSRMDEAAAISSITDFYPLNLRFHRRIIDFADNYKLSMMLPSLEAELHLFRTRGLIRPGAMSVSNAEHRSIVKALAAGDVTAAQRLLERHINAGKARFLKSVDDHEHSAPRAVSDLTRRAASESFIVEST